MKCLATRLYIFFPLQRAVARDAADITQYSVTKPTLEEEMAVEAWQVEDWAD